MVVAPGPIDLFINDKSHNYSLQHCDGDCDGDYAAAAADDDDDADHYYHTVVTSPLIMKYQAQYNAGVCLPDIII